jgi:ribosomal protein L35
MKTNKSFTHRLKLTKKGKVIARVPGQNHFNAKSSGEERLARRRTSTFAMTPKTQSRFLGK